MDRRQLRQALQDSFSLNDLRALCFDLGLDYRSFDDGSTAALAMGLIAACEQHSRMAELLDLARESKPYVNWDYQFLSSTPTAQKFPDSAAYISSAGHTARELPQGTVTFLFTDIERSTPLWEQFPEAMKVALARHDDILRRSVEEAGGMVVKSTGDGAYAAFAVPAEGLNAAVRLQRQLAAENWPMLNGERIRVRAGLHAGEAELREGDYHGPTLNRAARLMSAGHGDQVLLSSAMASLVQARLPENVTLRDLGGHHLKGLAMPERIFQVEAPGLGADFPPLSVLDTYLGNLPPSLTSFIGRQRELSDIRHMLLNTRLLTLVGVGGTGKTRLSLEVAAERQQAYRHGAWLVELAPIRNPEMVPLAVTDTFHLTPPAGVALEQALVTFLQGRHLLLVLDNCEHLAEPCARLADHLLRHCPELTILATSREGLGVSGEAIYPVPALPLPPADGLAAEEAQEYEAVRLFAERAQALKPAFRITGANVRAVVEITRRLDGIPLAIELAAARVNLFAPDQIATRLQDRFRLLAGGGRTVIPRQQTLRAAVDWSYDLLSEEERQMFQRLSIFPAGWTYEAAEAVSGRLDVMDLLPSLINKSLVQVDESGVESRYYFLETIREYALERLAEHEDPDRFLGRMLNYLSEWAVANEPEFRGANQLEWLHRFDAENDNFRVALEWGLNHDPATAARLAAALSLFWFMHGSFREGRYTYSRLEEQLAERDIRLSTLDRARFLQGYCSTIWPLSDYVKAERLAREGIPLFRESGDMAGLVNMQHNLAMVVEIQGRVEEAGTIREAAITLARENGIHYTLAHLLLIKGVRYYEKGNLEEAYANIFEALDVSRQYGVEWNEMGMFSWLGRVELARDNFAAAREHTEAYQAAARRFNDRRAIAGSSELQGLIALKEGNLAEARRQAEMAIHQLREIGLHVSRAMLLLGDIAAAAGDHDEARHHYETALTEATLSGDQPYIEQARKRLATMD
jgi:predicted ATPase/class 3 adenylate cyclase